MDPLPLHDRPSLGGPHHLTVPPTVIQASYFATSQVVKIHAADVSETERHAERRYGGPNATSTSSDTGDVTSVADALATAKHWRNRWYMKDGHCFWGRGIFPSHQDAARYASEAVRDWEFWGWAHSPDGMRFPASQFRMVLQLPVGGVA